MGPEEAARKCAPQKGSPGRKRTSAKPQQHRAYASWEDENKENIDPRTQRKASSPTQMGDYDVLPGPDDEEPTPAAAPPATMRI